MCGIADDQGRWGCGLGKSHPRSPDHAASAFDDPPANEREQRLAEELERYKMKLEDYNSRLPMLFAGVSGMAIVVTPPSAEEGGRGRAAPVRRQAVRTQSSPAEPCLAQSVLGSSCSSGCAASLGEGTPLGARPASSGGRPAQRRETTPALGCSHSLPSLPLAQGLPPPTAGRFAPSSPATSAWSGATTRSALELPDERLLEAQSLLAEMLTPGSSRPRLQHGGRGQSSHRGRRHGSAPPSQPSPAWQLPAPSAHAAAAAVAAEAAHAASKASPASPAGIVSRRRRRHERTLSVPETFAPLPAPTARAAPLKPLNGSMPWFPPMSSHDNGDGCARRAATRGGHERAASFGAFSGTQLEARQWPRLPEPEPRPSLQIPGHKRVVSDPSLGIRLAPAASAAPSPAAPTSTASAASEDAMFCELLRQALGADTPAERGSASSSCFVTAVPSLAHEDASRRDAAAREEDSRASALSTQRLPRVCP